MVPEWNQIIIYVLKQATIQGYFCLFCDFCKVDSLAFFQGDCGGGRLFLRLPPADILVFSLKFGASYQQQ